MLIEQWRTHYSTARPHSSLSYRPPAPETVCPVLPQRPEPPIADGLSATKCRSPLTFVRITQWGWSPAMECHVLGWLGFAPGMLGSASTQPSSYGNPIRCCRRERRNCKPRLLITIDPHSQPLTNPQSPNGLHLTGAPVTDQAKAMQL